MKRVWSSNKEGNFRKAKASSPCVLVFDDSDSLAGLRADGVGEI